MSSPIIQLKFDRKLDQNLAWDFYSDSEFGGCNFWKERALAEIVNVVVQDTDNFIQLHGKIKSSGYPNHRNLIIKGNNLWRKRQDVSQWIIEMMKII